MLKQTLLGQVSLSIPQVMAKVFSLALERMERLALHFRLLLRKVPNQNSKGYKQKEMSCSLLVATPKMTLSSKRWVDRSKLSSLDRNSRAWWWTEILKSLIFSLNLMINNYRLMNKFWCKILYLEYQINFICLYNSHFTDYDFFWPKWIVNLILILETLQRQLHFLWTRQGSDAYLSLFIKVVFQVLGLSLLCLHHSSLKGLSFFPHQPE